MNSLLRLLVTASLGATMSVSSLLTAAPSSHKAPRSPGIDSRPALAYKVTAVENRDGRRIVPGDPWWVVDESIGRPNRKINEETWVFRNFVPSLPRAVEDGCTTLLITVTHDHVADMKMVNVQAEQAIARGARFVARERSATLAGR